MKKVAVILLNYNTEKDTRECISSVLKSELDGIKLSIYVVDNASQENTEKLETFISKVSSQEIPVNFIQNGKNLGFAGGNNSGIKEAIKHAPTFLLILNNDTVVDKRCIWELVNAAQQKVGIVTAKIYFAKGHEYHKQRYKKEDLGKVIWYAGGVMDWKNVVGHHKGVDEVDKGQYQFKSNTDFATGACMLIRSEVMRNVGYFDEKFFLYYEDADLCEKVKKQNYDLVYTPEAVLWHKNASSSGGSGSSLQDYYITRNRLLFGMRHAPLRSKLALITESAKILISGRKWQKIGVRDYYLKKLGRGSY